MIRNGMKVTVESKVADAKYKEEKEQLKQQVVDGDLSIKEYKMQLELTKPKKEPKRNFADMDIDRIFNKDRTYIYNYLLNKYDTSGVGSIIFQFIGGKHASVFKQIFTDQIRWYKDDVDGDTIEYYDFTNDRYATREFNEVAARTMITEIINSLYINTCPYVVAFEKAVNTICESDEHDAARQEMLITNDTSNDLIQTSYFDSFQFFASLLRMRSQFSHDLVLDKSECSSIDTNNVD